MNFLMLLGPIQWMSNHDDMMDVGKKILNDFGKVDILVNNANSEDNLMLRMNEDE